MMSPITKRTRGSHEKKMREKDPRRSKSSIFKEHYLWEKKKICIGDNRQQQWQGARPILTHWQLAPPNAAIIEHGTPRQRITACVSCRLYRYLTVTAVCRLSPNKLLPEGTKKCKSLFRKLLFEAFKKLR